MSERSVFKVDKLSNPCLVCRQYINLKKLAPRHYYRYIKTHTIAKAITRVKEISSYVTYSVTQRLTGRVPLK